MPAAVAVQTESSGGQGTHGNHRAGPAAAGYNSQVVPLPRTGLDH